ncbi:MAG: hypothetical protein MZV64_10250 [Ignavibacteriales bacterium]|nr:hypothetical protein [Ignavibacteriales bacterium]
MRQSARTADCATNWSMPTPTPIAGPDAARSLRTCRVRASSPTSSPTPSRCCCISRTPSSCFSPAPSKPCRA